MTRMARPTKPPVPPARKRGPLPVILAVAVVVAGGVFFYLHSTEKQETEPQAAPVAAVQPEVTTPRAIAKNHISSTTADPKAEIAAALVQRFRSTRAFRRSPCSMRTASFYTRSSPGSLRACARWIPHR